MTGRSEKRAARVAANRQAIEDAAMAAARKLGEWGYAHIAAEVHIPVERATDIVRGWLAQGLAEIVRQARGAQPRLFRLCGTAVEALQRPRGRTPEDNLWTAMRGLVSFTPTDIAAHATNDLIVVPVDHARAYCRLLMQAGYLRVERKADPAREREARYRLIQNTGPLPPRERRVRAVVDANTRAVKVLSVTGASA
ncbi:MAG: hypothetical protein KF887_06970 [Paracoccaceae bacterium]|nr:MAG: hypothetical protein KF887_06970 [Paracoccaceae bacterium]